jgi:DNA-binding PadR family transcriptional regulator
MEALALSHELAGLGRFAEPSLAILLALAEGPLHGYAIMTAAREITGEPLGPGTLYATLSRLELIRLIEALPADDRRRPYRLTPAGTAVLQARLERIEDMARTGLARLRRTEGSRRSNS